MAAAERPTLSLQPIQRSASSMVLKPLNPHHEKAGIWGWAFYRTIYTPKSNEQWDEVKKQLDKLILNDFVGFNVGADPGSLNAARDNHRTFIFDDAEKFNNASFEALEIHFQDWVSTTPEIQTGSNYSATWKAFLILDEQAFRNILAAPVEALLTLRRNKLRFQDYGVTAFSRRRDPDTIYYDEETGEEHFLDEEEPEFEHIDTPSSWPGQFQVSAIRLYTFWEELTGYETTMESMWESETGFRDGVWTDGW